MFDSPFKAPEMVIRGQPRWSSVCVEEELDGRVAFNRRWAEQLTPNTVCAFERPQGSFDDGRCLVVRGLEGDGVILTENASGESVLRRRPDFANERADRGLDVLKFNPRSTQRGDADFPRCCRCRPRGCWWSCCARSGSAARRASCRICRWLACTFPRTCSAFRPRRLDCGGN